MKEFKIQEKPELSLRFKDISPVKMLALQMTIDFESMDKSEKLFSFILENTEVDIAGTWTNVKEQGRDVYFPIGIEADLNALMEICTTFLNEVLKPVFTKSSR